jgi:hypothetical protein
VGTFYSPNQFSGLRYDGTGALISDNGFSVNYTGATEIPTGSVRLGTGGAAVGLNNHAISGSTTGTGTLVIDHSGSLAMSNPISGALNIQRVGSGTTSLDGSSFGTGTISVSNGKLLINGGVVAGQTGTGTRPVSIQIWIDTSAANGLLIGQPLTVSGSNNNTPFSNELYILSKAVDVELFFRTGIGSAEKPAVAARICGRSICGGCGLLSRLAMVSCSVAVDARLAKYCNVRHEI